MVRTQSTPPSLNLADIGQAGATVTVKEAKIVTDIKTSMGVMKKGINLVVVLGGHDYYKLMTLRDDLIAGSLGRLLVSAGIDDTDAPDFETKLQSLVGRQVRVVRRGGKDYWYP